jgi:hypothetical protein
MAYEIFKRTVTRAEAPTLSIVPDGRITINAAASRILLGAGMKSALLLWDRTGHKVALKAAQRGDKNAYAVSFSRARSGTIRAKSFLRHIGWNGDEREMVSANWNEKEKMLEATLPPDNFATERAGNQK